MSPLPFNNDTLRRWVATQTPFDANGKHNWVGEVLDFDDLERHFFVYGSGPFSFESLYAFGETHGVYMYDLAEWSDYDDLALDLVIGAEDWKEEILGGYLDGAVEWKKDDGSGIRIYSQEMFLFRLMSGIDPYDAPIEVLREFGRGHPALDYLANLGFDWPSCQSFPGIEPLSSLEGVPGSSPLAVMGYHVGEDNGIADDDTRQGILERAFRGPLPTVGSPSYMAEWGAPNTSDRLKKMANKLASHVRNAKRRNVNMEIAIARWETDLEWLRRKFYTGRFQFQWPSY